MRKVSQQEDSQYSSHTIGTGNITFELFRILIDVKQKNINFIKRVSDYYSFTFTGLLVHQFL